MAADAGEAVIGAQHHERGVPADDAPHPQLHLLVAREGRLLLGGEGVDVARLHQAGKADAELAGALEHLAEQEVSPLGSMGLHHPVEGVDPLLGLSGVGVRELALEVVEQLVALVALVFDHRHGYRHLVGRSGTGRIPQLPFRLPTAATCAVTRGDAAGPGLRRGAVTTLRSCGRVPAPSPSSGDVDQPLASRRRPGRARTLVLLSLLRPGARGRTPGPRRPHAWSANELVILSTADVQGMTSPCGCAAIGGLALVRIHRQHSDGPRTCWSWTPASSCANDASIRTWRFHVGGLAALGVELRR